MKITIIILSGVLTASCTKDVPKELLNKQNTQNNQQQDINRQQMPDDSIHRNLSQNNSGDTKEQDNSQGDLKGDAKAEQVVKEADDADALYKKTKSESDKKNCVNKQLAAANYLMFEANLSPKKKYRTALQRYRRVLELDSRNSEAIANKQQIEDIYRSMGMPVPN